MPGNQTLTNGHDLKGGAGVVGIDELPDGRVLDRCGKLVFVRQVD